MGASILPMRLRSLFLFGMLGTLATAGVWFMVELDKQTGNHDVAVGPERGMSAEQRARRTRSRSTRPPRSADAPPDEASNARVRARVVNDVGRPIPYFRSWVVRAEDAVVGPDGELGVPDDLHPIDGREGRLRVFGLEPGAWKLRVAARGHLTRTLDLDLPLDEALEIHLTRTASIEGRVELAGGVPAVGAQVGVVRTEGEPRWIDVDAEGRFRVGSLPPGDQAVTARIEGRDEQAERIALTLAPGETRGDVVVRISAQGTVRGELAGTIAGRSERRVLAQRTSGGEPHRATTDSEGRFAFELPVGEYRVMLDWTRAEVGSDAWIEAYAGRSETRAVVREGETSRVVLGARPPTAVDVRGRVTDRRGPVARAVVSAYEPEIAARVTVTRTGSDGSYTLTLPAPGTYELTVGEPPDGPVSFVEEVAGGPLHVADLELPSGRIEGQVSTAAGPLESALVVVVRGDDEPTLHGDARSTVTDGLGRFVLPHLEGGLYHARVFGELDGEALGMHWLPDLVVTENRPLRDLAVLLEPSATVRGTVHDARGAPLENAELTVLDESGREVLAEGTFRTDGGGRFVCEGLGGGIVRLRASHGERTGERRLVLVPGRETRIEFRL